MLGSRESVECGQSVSLRVSEVSTYTWQGDSCMHANSMKQLDICIHKEQPGVCIHTFRKTQAWASHLRLTVRGHSNFKSESEVGIYALKKAWAWPLYPS
jgi:hypothetical protein